MQFYARYDINIRRSKIHFTEDVGNSEISNCNTSPRDSSTTSHGQSSTAASLVQLVGLLCKNGVVRIETKFFNAHLYEVEKNKKISKQARHLARNQE